MLVNSSLLSKLRSRLNAGFGWAKNNLFKYKFFTITVVIPTVLGIIYFGVLASDVYISESRFIIHSTKPESPNLGGALSVLPGIGGAGAAGINSLSAHDYILSRDALTRLNREVDFAKVYSSDEISIFNRFGVLPWRRSFEALYEYYRYQVTVETDPISSISVLQVEAYSAELAYLINEKLLEMSEQLVNKLNEEANQDMVRFAKSEVAEAEKKAAEAALAVSNYRNQTGVIDPAKQSLMKLQQVSKLQEELFVAKSQLEQLRNFAPANPQIPPLQKRIETLQGLIKAENTQVTGGAGSSYASVTAEYVRLDLLSQFADKQLMVALGSLEKARNDAMHKQIYLERVVQPNKPDYALKPRRILCILATFLASLILWGILSLLLAAVKDHLD